MHEWTAALILALVLGGAALPQGTAAERGDAAIKAREGDIDHWIEYYRQSRQQAPAAVAPAPPGPNAGETPTANKPRDARHEDGKREE